MTDTCYGLRRTAPHRAGSPGSGRSDPLLPSPCTTSHSSPPLAPAPTSCGSLLLKDGVRVSLFCSDGPTSAQHLGLTVVKTDFQVRVRGVFHQHHFGELGVQSHFRSFGFYKLHKLGGVLVLLPVFFC